MGNNLSKEVVSACQQFDLKRLTEIFNSDEGKDFNVFDIIYTNEHFPDDNFDCLALIIAHRNSGFPLMPFLELIKKQIEKPSNKNKKPQLNKQKKTYLERLIEKGGSSTKQAAEEFNFFLDNSDIIPLSDESDLEEQHCSVILHALASDINAVPLLQDYLSSGKVESRFKNSDNDGEKMRHPEKYDKLTPLQLACRKVNLEAVRELAVNNIGGKNYGEAIEEMLYYEYASGRESQKPESAAVDICLCLLSQPNADDIRNYVVKHPTLLEVIQCKIPSSPSFHPPPRTTLLKIEIRLQDDEKVQLAAAAFAIGLDKVYECLIGNGCQVQEKKLASIGLVDAASRGKIETVSKILVDLRAQDKIVDVTGGGNPFVSSFSNACSPAMTDLLLKAGASPKGRTTQSPLNSAMAVRNDNITDADRIAVMTSLIKNGADVNFQEEEYKYTALARIVSGNLSDEVLQTFLELTKEKNLDANLVDFRGDSPLHDAIARNNIFAVKALIPITDPNIQNKEGKTPKEFAKGPFDYGTDRKRTEINILFGDNIDADKKKVEE